MFLAAMLTTPFPGSIEENGIEGGATDVAYVFI
jgi:hypothetical protein